MITVGRVKIDRDWQSYIAAHPEQREKARARTKAWVAANRERKLAADAVRRVENAEEIKEYRKAYYQKNKEKMLAEMRERYKANPEPYKKRAAKWARLNMKKVTARNSARRIKRRERLRLKLFKLQGGKCAYCREKLVAGKMHVDHIMPVVLGGSNKHANLQLTCDVCNFSKNRRHPIEYARTLGRLL